MIRCQVAQITRALSSPSLPKPQSTLYLQFSSKELCSRSCFWGFCLLLLLCMAIPSPSSLLTPNVANSCSSFRTPRRRPLLQEAFPETSPARLTHVPLLHAPTAFCALPLFMSSYHSRGNYSFAYLSLLLAPTEGRSPGFPHPG